MNRRVLGHVLAGLAAAAICGPAQAQTYPDHPVRMIIPYAAGGPFDVVVRLISAKAESLLGQPIVIDNRGGAGGLIGTDAAVKAAADGYTIVTVSPGQTSIGLAIQPSMPYDPVKDLVPVIQLVEERLLLVGKSSLPAKTTAELVAYLKANPGKENYSSASTGSMSHMTMELLKQKVGIDVTHVPYKGVAPALTAILSGEVGLTFATPGSTKAYIAEGKMKPFALAAASRSSAAPEIPTMTEAGFSGLDAPLWYAVMAPKGTPEPAIKKLYDAYSGALKDPDVKAKLATMGVEISGASPGELNKMLAADIVRWGDVQKAAKIKLE